MSTKSRSIPTAAMLALLTGACAHTPEAPTAAPPATAIPSAASAAPVTPPPPVASAAPPTDAERAQKERAKAESDHQAELARWTPELHAAAKRLSEASYPTADAALRRVFKPPE